MNLKNSGRYTLQRNVKQTRYIAEKCLMSVSSDTEKCNWSLFAGESERFPARRPELSSRKPHGTQFSRVVVSGKSDDPVLVRSGVISSVFKSITNTSPVESLAN